MKDLKKTNELIILYDLYSSLLTPKQIEYFELYFFDDYSLSEIAGQRNVSRNAVYDSLLKITNALHKFEQNLQLGYKQQQREVVYQQFDKIKECDLLIKKLKEIDND
ncbi:YlxM family DNA-binding protein [Spiroplasma sp. SV19]|uniref:YlxM family DNA-binding protein n=1 Tax=Spiroplasma sp. SV19 TaxID=2570468 RepID=UPI0024B6D390|nr:DNA-binding protein [Spiroplasma sp. SV19]WHQ37002.1 DNA-binding protein [Spiroplasma sp. SV19]